MYIPLLTGRADWGAWSDLVSTAIMNMNLYGHIAERYTPQYGFDPRSKPTYPPIIDENASQSDIISWYDWWHRAVLYPPPQIPHGLHMDSILKRPQATILLKIHVDSTWS